MRVDLVAEGVNHVIADSLPDVFSSWEGFTVGKSLWAYLSSDTDADIYLWTDKGWVEQSLTAPGAISTRNLLLAAAGSLLDMAKYA